MRIAFTTLPALSHTKALTSIARAVRARGHDIVFIGFLDHEDMIHKAGFDFVSIARERYPLGTLSNETEPLSILSERQGVEYTYEILGKRCRAVLNDGARALRASGAQGLVVDTAAKGFDAVAITQGIPYIHVSAAVHSDESGHTPIWMFDWLHSTGAEALRRNRTGLDEFSKLGTPFRSAIREYLDRFGIAIDWSRPYPLLSPIAWITQIPKEFDFPSEHWPSQLHYVGPYFDQQENNDIEFPWSRLTGEPLIYASMGTVQNGLADVFRVIARAAAAPGRQVILSTGGRIQVADLGPFPDGVIAVQFAPQLELLRRASLCITHAGLNTVLEALACGVPQVAIPITNDQPGVASRVAYSGTGLFMPFKALAEEPLRKMVDEVLTNPTYRNAAQQMQTKIQALRGSERAADIIHISLAR